MTYEQELKDSYKIIHHRLVNTQPPPSPQPIHHILATDCLSIEELLHPITLDKIVNVVCRIEDVRLIDVVSRRRGGRDFKDQTAHVRHIIYYLCKEYSLKSTTQIGRKLHKDHTTIIYGHKKIARERLRDASLNQKLKTYEDIFQVNQ